MGKIATDKMGITEAVAKLQAQGLRVQEHPHQPPEWRYIVRGPVAHSPYHDGQGERMSAEEVIARAKGQAAPTA